MCAIVAPEGVVLETLPHVQDLIFLSGLALSVGAFWVLVAFCLPGTSVFGLLGRILRRHATDWIWVVYAATLAAIILLDILETRADAAITAHLGRDFTPLFLTLEGSATALFQVLNHPLLTALLSGVYLYVFPVMGVAALVVTYQGGEFALTRKIFWGAILNYLLILPFYILVPVSERWASPDGSVRLLMDELSPFLLAGLRPLSGLNNCFPSFHVSLAFTIAIACATSANARLRNTMRALAWAVLFSTLYLGFHWTLDVFGGILFGAGCSLLASWAVEKRPLEAVLLRVRAR